MIERRRYIDGAISDGGVRHSRCCMTVLWGVLFVLALTGCNSRRPLPTQEELLRQDSLERLARQQKPRVYDSPEEEMLMQLPYRTLPVTYEEGFEQSLPGFEEIAPTMVPSLLGVSGLTKTKAIRLPDKDSIHVVLVGGLNAMGDPIVYMTTLSPRWEPVDKLAVYEQSDPEEEDEEYADDEFVDEEDLGKVRIEFSVTSRYVIYMQVVFQSYVDDERELEGVSVYSIGRDGKFFELEENELNHGAEE